MEESDLQNNRAKYVVLNKYLVLLIRLRDTFVTFRYPKKTLRPIKKSRGTNIKLEFAFSVNMINNCEVAMKRSCSAFKLKS